MKYNYFKYEINGVKYCGVDVDKTRVNGILRCSHEISVTFIFKDGAWKFYDAWHVGVCEMSWNEKEQKDFEETFPGLLTEMIDGIGKEM